MLREHERGAADSLTSMSVILGDLELELQAHRELDAELDGSV